jgi:hypothetical protein
MSKFYPLILALCIASSAAAEELYLKSSQGAEVVLKYSVVKETANSNKPSSRTFAQPLRFIVNRADLDSSVDQVRVVLINRESVSGSCGKPSYERAPEYVIDLTYYRGAFVGDFADARILLDGREVPLLEGDRRLQVQADQYCSLLTTHQEMSLVINGEWQTDPMNGTNNFKLELNR